MQTAQQINKELDKLSSKREILKQQLDIIRANRTFKCVACGKRHKIKDCEVIQTHWYVKPSGCTDGGYWNESDLMILCPTSPVRNRVYFPSPIGLQYEFTYLYKHLFKKVIDEYENGTPLDREYEFINNEYFENNAKRFELSCPKFKREY